MILGELPLLRLEGLEQVVAAPGDAGRHDVQEREPLVRKGFHHELDGPLEVAREGAPDPRRPERDRELAGVDRGLGVAVVRGLRLVSGGGRGRALALREAVDLVVHEDVGDVQVSPRGVHEVVAADRDSVAVAAHRDDPEVRARDLDSRGERDGAAVKAVHAERGDVAGKTRRAADARDDDRLPGLHLQLGERAVEAGQDAEVAATGAPDGLQLGLVVGGLELGERRGFAHAGTFSETCSAAKSAAISASTSATVRCLPPDLLKTCVRPAGRSMTVRRYL